MSQPFRSQKEIIQSYQQAVNNYTSDIQKLRKTKRILAIARLLTAAMGFGFCWYAGPSPSFIIALIIFTSLFIYLVFRDADKTSLIKNNERLIEINEHEINAMLQNLTSYDEGQIFADPTHAYTSDLDIFGNASLFQWLSRCHAEQSKRRLSELLKSPQSVAAISSRQEAAKELSEKQKTCQEFQSVAMANPLSFKTETRLKHWMDQTSGPYKKPYWRWVKNLYPVLTMGILALYMFDFISPGSFTFFCIGFLAFAFFLSSKINPVYEMLSLIQPEMDSLHGQLHLIEKEQFNSPWLREIQNRLKPTGYSSSASAIRDFHSILKKFEFRLNLVVFIILNSLFLWDLRQLLSLNEWKTKNKFQLKESFGVIAEMEVMISIASLVHNEPTWSFPEVDEAYFHFYAKEIGHPLIHPADRILNDFSMEGTGKIAVITGSNMAGKSTFLRSLGINAVLAQIGASVCAKQMSLSNMKLISSMRVADNLAENTSTFYAELKKLQHIIESVNQREQTFILLDEVLRGTNSTDRHKGSRALIRQLLRQDAVAVMATHDTELAHAESAANKSVVNYYFEGRIEGDELYFDYKIKRGICESLNATTLMKKIGIHFQD